MTLLDGMLIQIILFILIFLGMGLCIDLLKIIHGKIFFSSDIIMTISGYIGIPVHEIFHLLMVLIFGYKVKNVSLIEKQGSVLYGHVDYVYNRYSIIHVIGLFFAATAPFVLGLSLLGLMLKLIDPNIFNQLINLNFDYSFISFKALMTDLFLQFFDSFKILLNLKIFSWKSIIFFILGTSIALYSSLSVADVKAAFKSMKYIFPIFLIFNIALYFISYHSYYDVIGVIISVAKIVFSLFSISIVLILFLFALSFIMHIFTQLYHLSKKTKNNEGV